MPDQDQLSAAKECLAKMAGLEPMPMPPPFPEAEVLDQMSREQLVSLARMLHTATAQNAVLVNQLMPAINKLTADYVQAVEVLGRLERMAQR